MKAKLSWSLAAAGLAVCALRGEPDNGPRLELNSQHVGTSANPTVAPLASDSAPQPVGRPEDATVQRRSVEFERVAAIARVKGSVRVLVEFDVPNLQALSAASRGAKDRAATVAADARLSGAINNVRQGELARLAGVQHAVNRTYASIPFAALTVSEQALAVLQASPGVVGINEDRLAAPLLDHTVNIVGASAAWAKGFDGSGWYVAILDTGIRATHNFFAGKSIVQACFSSGQDGVGPAGDCPNGLSTDTTSPNAARHFPTAPTSEHGTHVSGIATGNDPTRVPPLYGIARGANIIAAQVFSQFFSDPQCGGGDCVLSYTSDQIGGLEHVYSLRSTYNISSVNMSIGGGSYNNQALCDADNAAEKAAIDNLRAAGIATVIASGNGGSCDGVSSPACISSAVAIGATTDSDVEASFSNYQAALLDLYAPGENILSSVATSDSSYDGTWSGTSMATPHVTGAWAILKQVDPSASVSTLLGALQSTGKPVAGRCVGTPSQRRIQIDEAMNELGIKFNQPPDASGEDVASNIDSTDLSPDAVAADDFVSDGRPITAVRWWGSNLSLGSATAVAAANSPPGIPASAAEVQQWLDGSRRGRAGAEQPYFGQKVIPPADLVVRGDTPATVATGGGDTCATATVITTLPFSDSGSTCAFADDYDEICPFNTPGSPDVVYRYTAVSNGQITVSLCRNSNYDTKVYVYENLCGAYQSGIFAACNDDSCSTPSYPNPYVSTVQDVSVVAGTTYYIVVDGYSGVCGNYTIDVTFIPPCFVPPLGACLLANPDFEGGGICGWTATTTGLGGWVKNDGLHDPAGPDGPLAPCGGGFGAMTDSTGGGTRVLYQDIAIPAASSVNLRWTAMIRNHAAAFQDPDQGFRVEIRNPADDSVLATVFSTHPGDTAFQPCTPGCADISAFAGQTVRVAFVEQDSLFFLNVHVDDVCIVLNEPCPTGACCQAGTGACLLDQIATNCVATGGVYQGHATTTCTTCPVMICGDGIVGTGEQCDPPNGVTCDNNCQLIANPPIDGWMISFHEPLTTGGSPAPPLALYFCDASVVGVAATALAACDAHPVRQYKVDLVDCCLVQSNADSRNGLTPGQHDAFHETQCFRYDIDIQAVIGHKFVDSGGTCVEVPTGNTATVDFWGWHTTSVEHGLQAALRSVVSMAGPNWLYGPWSTLTPSCSAPNMAFQLLTNVPGGGDCNNNGLPDMCETFPDCQPNGVPDECDISAGTSHDCDGNHIPDECDIRDHTFPDCQPNGVPDGCDILAGTSKDCDGGGIPDECDIRDGTFPDCQPDGIPDVCQLGANDTNGNGIPDACDPAPPQATPPPDKNRYVGLVVPPPATGPAYRVDDGSAENSIGVNGGGQGKAFGWANRFTNTTGGPITILTIDVAFGFPGVVIGVTPGDAVDAVIWIDAAATANMRNAVKAARWSLPGGVHANNGTFATHAVPSGGVVIPAGADFYVGLGDIQSSIDSVLRYPAAIDLTPPSAVKSWAFYYPTQNLFNPDNFTGQTIGTVDSLGVHGNWLIRAHAAGPGVPAALRVRMMDLQNPVPPNALCCPPPDFSAYEAGASCTDPGACARWVGKPGTFLESQDTPALGNFKAARLRCTPYYHDWSAEGVFYVTGAEVVPSSKYDVQVFAASCEGIEGSCLDVSPTLRVQTARWGDVEAPYSPLVAGQPNAIDVAQMVNKFKNIAGAPAKARAQLQPNLPELNADLSALDISAAVDAVKGFAYSYSGPCPCPSTVVCGVTACPSGVGTCVAAYGPGATCVKICAGGPNDGDPCMDNNPVHNHCPGGTCGSPFCRDRCGRCSPP